MKEHVQQIPNYELLQQLLTYIECPHGCESKKTVAKLQDDGKGMMVYCNQCGTIVFDSNADKIKTEMNSLQKPKI